MLIPKHGGYKNLESYKTAVIVYDGTVFFCKTHMTYKTNMSYRTNDQMIQAARSGKQNIVEGSIDSGTSKKTELKLIGVARGTYGELLEDYEDFLRQRNLPLWGKDSPESQAVRRLAYTTNKSYATYKSYIENENAETAANCLICLIHQTNYLLDQLLRSLEKDFTDLFGQALLMENGGFTEALYTVRRKARGL